MDYHKRNLEKMKQKEAALQDKIRNQAAEQNKKEEWKMKKFQKVESKVPIVNPRDLSIEEKKEPAQGKEN